MSAEVLNPLLAFGAGALTILSPCVLPLTPIVLHSAAQQSRMAPLALSAGLVAGFTSFGFALAAFGTALALDGEVTRAIGAGALLLVGVALLIPGSQQRLALAGAPLIAWAGRRQSALENKGLAGQAGIGLLLGMVWSPCVGPTLGAATVLAAQGERLTQVALVMAAFGVGIATMLLLVGLAGRALFARLRRRLITTGTHGKHVLGAMLVVVGVAILTGADRIAEGALVTASPDWLIDLTTRL